VATSARKHLVTLLAICLLAGCEKQSPQSHVAVYTSLEPDEVGKLVEQFEADHPEIVLDVTRDSTPNIRAKLLAEAANPQADVVWGLAETSLLDADRAGLLAAYAPAGAEQLSPEFRDNRAVPHWVGIDGYMTAFAVNTAKIAEENVAIPQSYADLIKPVYRGMIAMPDPNKSDAGYLIVAGILQIMGEDAGWLYLEQLDQNVAVYASSGSIPVLSASTGEHPIGISFDFRVLEEKNKGGPLEIVFPTDRSGWEMDANALIQKPSINPSAKVFLNWALSAEAFKSYSEHAVLMANPAYTHPPQGFPAQVRQQMIKNDFGWASENRDRILAEWTRRFGGRGK
jgi:iron(III) transport system substrate-binding protein